MLPSASLWSAVRIWLGVRNRIETLFRLLTQEILLEESEPRTEGQNQDYMVKIKARLKEGTRTKRTEGPRLKSEQRPG